MPSKPNGTGSGVFLGLEVGGVLEEVVVKHTRDAEQQLGVDVAIGEDLVGVGAVAMDGTGEPGDGASLPLKLGLYHVSEVNVSHRDSVLLLR